ncbi:helix-turn-helix domain-containing protein [Deltaproteobacteria bacterium OttesenSCG-928-K17]|nr:helix-turn-helix domain-containing protein [Deltaproteobacteria bacterium OttesenSCG-928-K17]
MNVESSGFVIHYGDFRMQDWLLKAEISAGAKLTYSVLACCAGGRDYVWPSQEFLAEKVSVSVRTLQRYLSELVRFGLIEKCKQYIKGQVRNVYRFLLHSVIGISEKSRPQDAVGNDLPWSAQKHNILCSDQSDNLSPRSEPELILPPAVAKLENHLQTDTTICTDRHDKMSSSLNKEETIKGKEYNPPTPQTDVPVALGDADCGVSGNGGDIFLESKEDDPDWIKAKSTLEERLTVGNFRTWIMPLIFERNGSEIILRGPNQFFLNWVKRHFSDEISAALASCGLMAWQFDLMTEEQQRADQARQEEKRAEVTKAEIKPNAPVEDVDALPLEEQYDRLYRAYRGDDCLSGKPGEYLPSYPLHCVEKSLSR